MSKITSQQIKDLREKTNISVMACKKALEEANGDMAQALEILKKEGFKVAEKKSERALRAGIIDAYVHSNKQAGVIIETRCETDFVAKNNEFLSFTHDVAMHITASLPKDAEELEGQPFIKDPSKTIGDYKKEMIQKFGENIEITKFIRYDTSSN
ncbi:MAG: translation elongation factor Ts [Patescibacteria group bacterium]